MSEPAKVPSHADLQQRALLALNNRSADSVAELARRVEAERASVSRTVHALADRGLVAHAARQWQLTAEGVAAVEAVTARQVAKVALAGQEAIRAQERHARMVRLMAQAVEPAFRDMALLQSETMRQVAATVGPDSETMRGIATRALGHLRPFVEQSAVLRLGIESGVRTEIGAGLASQVLEGLSEVLASVRYSDAFRAALDTQRLQFDFAEWLPKLETPWLKEFATSSLLPSSQIVADLSAMRNALTAAHQSVLLRLVPTLAAATEVATAHHAYAREVVPQGRRRTRIARDWSPGRADAHLVMPSLTTSRFVGATRRVVELTTDGAKARRFEDPEGRESLFVASLERLGGPLVTLWRTAWHELTSAGPDPTRMAAHAGRELLAQALELLAPDSLFPSTPRGEITRQMRVDAIAGKGGESRRDWARITTRHLTETYGLLSAEAHRRNALPRYDEHVAAGLLESTAGLIRVLIACAQERHSAAEPEEG